MAAIRAGATRFRRDRRGNVAITFSVSLVPMVLSVGAAVDFARAISLSEALRAAVDQAAIGAVGSSPDTAQTLAENLLSGAFASKGAPYTAQVTVVSANSLTVTATATMATTLMSNWIPTVSITKSATAEHTTAGRAGSTDDSCIFSLGETLTISTDTMTFNGSPSVNLTGCSLRSNKSMKCNGSPTYATSYAVGTIVGCSNPNPGQPVTPDIHAAIASNITKVCGAAAGGVVWNASTFGALPTGANVKSVAQSGYTEIHICGDLTLGGTNATSLTGDSPATDTVVVIENGGLIMSDGANVRASRTTFVLAGGSGSPTVRWPNGNGGNAASLKVSASVDPANPWKGLAIYQNPSVVESVDMSWPSGASFTVDGIMYFPNAQLTVSGQVLAGPSGCSKIVVGEFTLNGAVNLKQSAVGCSGMQVTQYSEPGAEATSNAYLLQ